MLHQIILDSLWDPISVSVLIPRVVKVHSLVLSSALPRNHSRPFQLMHPPMPVSKLINENLFPIGGGGFEFMDFVYFGSNVILSDGSLVFFCVV